MYNRHIYLFMEGLAVGFLNHMDYIYAVYQERSFTRAAEKLYISQPSLSLTIKKIENELGFAIFERGGKQIRTTPAGERYIRAIEDVMQIESELKKDVEDILTLKKGKISLGSTAFIASYILPDVLKKFKDAYPQIEISIVIERSVSLQQRLENGEIDMIIDNFSMSNEGLTYIPLSQEHIFIGIPKTFEINESITEYRVSKENVINGKIDYSSAKGLDVRLLQNESFILLKKGLKMRNIANKIFDQADMIPNIAIEFDHLHTAVSYANSGFGICFLGESILEFSGFCENLYLYLPNFENLTRVLYIAHKKLPKMSDAAKKLQCFIKEKFQLQ